ncbi:hypothetical protein ABGB18_09495 [Nonomuraea sp. B12E4]|uniref:hypothetical protein n=1 Tax=Nonomuraea sp. B12E4 TaxID=3153564 RepID=UPI00325F3001
MDGSTGDLQGTWTLNGSSIKSFIIDHPVHEDRYLAHACTESPNAGVEYWGETTLDDAGQAIVTLPDYFEALTLKDGRAVAVNTRTDEIRNASATYPTDGTFRIHGAPGVRMTWIVAARTGPEVADPARGEYHVQEVPLTAAGIASIDLKPEQVAELLAEHESGVFTLVDARTGMDL